MINAQHAEGRPLRRHYHIQYGRILLHAFLITSALILIAPIIWALFTSFKPTEEIITTTPKLLPETWTSEHYSKLGDAFPFFQFFKNSMIVSTASTVFIAVGCTTAGYVFAKYEFLGKGFLFFLVISTILIPLQAYIIPLYVAMKEIEWTNTYQGLILPTIVMSSGIFFMRQSIKSGVPDELIDAARVDGANEFHILFRIIFPLASAATAAICIVNWVFTWSQFLWPLIVSSKEDMYTMEVGLSYFQKAFITDYGGVMAAAMITILPVLVVFLIFRRQIIEGIATTGMKS